MMSTHDANIRVLTRAQVREVDRRAIEEFGIPGVVLMENAGRNAAALIATWSKPGNRVAIVCGPGNNGGDGFVIARHLSNGGRDVEVFLVGTPDKLRGDAQINHRVVERMRLPLCVVQDAGEIEQLGDQCRRAALIVDALLGTGFSGEPRPPISAAIDCMNYSGRPVVAIDVPSGMDCDTGEPAIGRLQVQTGRGCVRAWRTITFVAKKPGFLVPGAEAITGDVFVADIGAPTRLTTEIAGIPPG